MTKGIKVLKLEAGKEEAVLMENFGSGLGAMQEAVGGYVEAVRVGASITLWINEEGKLADLPFNFYLTDSMGRSRDYIAGTCIIAGTDEEGNTVSLTDDEINEIKERFLNRTRFNMSL